MNELAKDWEARCMKGSLRPTILINNYNYAQHLEFCIESVINQGTHKPEIILYDDGSTDHSLEVARRFGERITIIAESNYGRGHCFNQINAVNRAFQESTGDIIFLLDSDDAFASSKVQRVMEVFEERPDVELVQTCYQYIGLDNELLPWSPEAILPTPNPLRVIQFSGRQDYFFTPTSTLAFRRGFLEKALPIEEDELDLIVVDIRLTRLAAVTGTIHTVPDELTLYRQHHTSYSGRNRGDEQDKERLNGQIYRYMNRLMRQHNRMAVEYRQGASWTIWSYVKLALMIMVVSAPLKAKVAVYRTMFGRFAGILRRP